MPGPEVAGKLVGTDSDYRIRIGDYRVVYFVDDTAAAITIYRIRRRKDAYK